jgi:hypothetical protein
MADIVPTVGRIVLYSMSSQDCQDLYNQRAVGGFGNNPHQGDIYPAMVVAVWGTTPDSAVNLKVMLDGTDTLWRTSRVVGDSPGTYRWMDYQKKVASGEIEPTFHAVKEATKR